MMEELDVLKIISDRLESLHVPFMLTGSARDANSELQERDVRTLLDDTVDWPYLREWAPKLGVAELLDEIVK